MLFDLIFILAARPVAIWRQMAFHAPYCFEAAAPRTSVP